MKNGFMTMQHQDQRVSKFLEKLGRALLIALVIGFIIVALWVVLGPFRAWANDNGGFLTVLGVIVVVPFAIWSARLLDLSRRKQLAAAATNILIYELWHNLNYVGQIEKSYENNFNLFESENPTGLHVPHYGPRLAILEKFITVEHLSSLDERRRWGVLEIYAQLCALQEEFTRWRESLLKPPMFESRALYEAMSSTLLSIIDPLMRNMVDIWASQLATESFTAPSKEIESVAALIRSHIASGRCLHPTYKSSRLKSLSNTLKPTDIILCWRDDWGSAPVEVIELSLVAAPFDSWRSAGRS
jgi:hypothetical protein